MKNTLRIPPQNIEAEQAVLGSILIDQDAIIKVVDLVTPDDFYNPIHEKLFSTILELFDKHQPIDVMTLGNRLKEKNILKDIGGSSYLAELTNHVSTASHADHYAKLVREKRVLRDLIRASGEITEQAFEPAKEMEDLLDEIEQKILTISQRSLPQNFIHVKDELKGAYDRIEKLHEHKGTIRGVATGFEGLDNILSGFQKSDLVVLGARPSLGKTSLALDFARHAALTANIPVGVFSLEMSREQVIDRLISAASNVPLWKLRTGRIGSDMEFQMIQAGLDTLSKGSIFIDDTPSPNIMQMRAMARRLQIEHGLGLLIIDYLQLISPRRSSDNMVSQVTEISRGLKGLARELNVPVLALSQLSRAVDQRDDKRPKLHDLRESGCVAGDTLITRADTGERVTIQALAEREQQTPIPVYGIDKNLKVHVQPLIKAFPNGKKMVYELVLRSGRKIKASTNHPFFTITGWRPLETLTPGDSIATPRYLVTERPHNIRDAELILLAHLLGDGCILPKQPFHYTSADKENIAIVSRVAHELFGITGRLVRQKNWWHLYLPSPTPLTRGKRHPISNWFYSLGISLVRSYEKRVPEAVFYCDEDRIALFLKHLWATDGNVSWKRLRGRKPAAAIYYATTSRILARDIQSLLLRLGIQGTIRTSHKEGYRPCYQIHIQGARDQIAFLQGVGCYGARGDSIPALLDALEDIVQNTNTDIIPKEAWYTLVKPAKDMIGASWRTLSSGLSMSYCGNTLFEAGLSRERMGRVATALHSQKLAQYATSDIYWEKIAEIHKLGVEKVYDATVEGMHNFVANDIFIHNSIEQDADVVMFIYRKDKEKADAPPEEQNMTEIIISKHRNGPLGTVHLKFDPDMTSFKSVDKKHTLPEEF